MQVNCDIESLEKIRVVCFASNDDADWMANTIIEKLPCAKGLSFEWVLTWISWFIEQEYAVVLLEGSDLVGLAIGRPCSNIQLASTRCYHYEPEGPMLWVDGVISPDSEGVRQMWDFSSIRMLYAERVVYLNKRKKIKNYLLNEVKNRFHSRN